VYEVTILTIPKSLQWWSVGCMARVSSRIKTFHVTPTTV